MVARTHQEVFNSSFTKIEFDGGLKLPQTEQSKTLKKSVQFSPQNDIVEIPHINELSDEEIDAVWMRSEEFSAIRNECRRIIMAVEKGCNEALIGVELRGLDRHMLSQRKQKDAVRGILYRTVEKLQCFEDETGADVSDMLAEMCEKISSRAKEMAHKMALGDEVEANAT